MFVCVGVWHGRHAGELSKISFGWPMRLCEAMVRFAYVLDVLHAQRARAEHGEAGLHEEDEGSLGDTGVVLAFFTSGPSTFLKETCECAHDPLLLFQGLRVLAHKVSRMGPGVDRFAASFLARRHFYISNEREKGGAPTIACKKRGFTRTDCCQ